ADRPVVTAFDHGDAEPIAGLRIDAAFSEPTRDDAARRAAAEDDDVVVVLALTRLDRRRSWRPLRVETHQIALDPRVGQVLRALAIFLFFFPAELPGRSHQIPRSRDVLGVRIRNLVRVDNRKPLRVALRSVLGVIAVVNAQDPTAGGCVEPLELLALIGVG